MTLAPGARAGNTIVESVLGSGGMATVYRVRHQELGSLFALKVLDLVTADFTERFTAEGRFQASLRHENVVAVYDVLEVEGRPALLLEYVEGETLAEWLMQPRDLHAIETVFRGIVAGVDAAHAVGLVHRDLKPSNVLMAEAPDGVIPKVADFGVAKQEHADGQTRTGIGMGTPGYMAPEQYRDAKSVDKRADVFALGVTLYEMACGSTPFRGVDTLAMVQAAASGTYVAPRELRADLSPRIEETIHGCLVPDPERRFPDCTAIIQALDGLRERPTSPDTWMQPVPEPTPRPQVERTATWPEPDAPRPEAPDVRAPASRRGAAIVAATVGAIVVLGGVGAAGWWVAQPVGAGSAPLESVVVRPYVVEGAPDAGWLGTAMAADLTFALAQAGGPRVVSQSALERYEVPPRPSQLGADLDVAAVVEGRIQVRGDTLLVRTSVVRTSDDSLVWTDSRSGSIGAISGPSGLVASRLLGAFELATLPATDAPARRAAQRDYLRGREIVRRYDEARYDEAETWLNAAIETDPTFGTARATLARLYLHRGWHGENADTDWVAEAEAQVRRALEDEPTNPHALQVLGRAMVMRGELRGAFQVLNLAIQYAPESPDAYIDRYEAEVRAGAMDLAARDLAEAEALDPYYVRLHTNKAWFTTYTQRWDDLDTVLKTARARSIEHVWMHRAKAESLRRSRRDAPLREHLAAHPEPLTGAMFTRDEAWLSARVAEMAPLGPERPNGVIERARYEAALGRTDDAVASLRIALAAYPGYLCHVVDPVFDEVKQHADWPSIEAAALAESAELVKAFEATWTP